MFDTILVPLDGTRFAEAVLPGAVRLARRARGRLHLLLAHQPAAALVGMGEVAVHPGPDLGLQRQEEEYLADVVSRLDRMGAGPVGSRRLTAPAGDAICEEAGRVEAGLIVMATHGRSALGRLWLGSVSHHVIRHAGLPVLLVNPHRAHKVLEPRSGAGILVALDLSAFSEAVLEPVRELARLLEAHITLLHVVEPNYHPVEPPVPYPLEQDETVTEVRRADAQRRLDDIADRLRARGLGVSARVVIGPSAAAGVLEALEGPRYDLVAMTTHGAGGMRRLFLGNVADKIIRSAGKPVLVLRPEPLPEE
ncbi:MAG TPA: universal stress protein [Gemmatimonadales bacterium]|nr:universal stress protein [Gemmatimonadales bacterium]